MTSAISVAGLTRRYRGQHAVDNVSFDIEPGSITGLLGRNVLARRQFRTVLTPTAFSQSAGSYRR